MSLERQAEVRTAPSALQELEKCESALGRAIEMLRDREGLNAEEAAAAESPPPVHRPEDTAGAPPDVSLEFWEAFKPFAARCGVGNVIDTMPARGILALVEKFVDGLEQRLLPAAAAVEPHWEVVVAEYNGKRSGYRVRWSQPDAAGAYLWVRHYLTDSEPGDNSLGWCQNAAESNARNFNELGKRPEEFTSWKTMTPAEPLERRTP